MKHTIGNNFENKAADTDAVKTNNIKTDAVETSEVETDQVEINVQGKHFHTTPVLGPIQLSLPQRSFTVITGPSGCGKTTLLKMIAGLDQDNSGQAVIRQNTEKSSHTNTSLTIGFAFQEPRLLPWRTLRDNLQLVCQPDESVDILLEDMGLKDVADLYPGQISLGMARRVSLARAFAVKPDLLLLDEPLVSLDEPTAQRLREWLLDYWQQHRITVLMVTHNLQEALQLADHIVILADKPAHVQQIHHYTQPRNNRNRHWIEQQLQQLVL